MYYQTERELQSVLVNLDFGISTFKTKPMIRREISIGGCKPDVVCVHFMNQSDIVLSQFQWSYKHVYVIWLLRKWHRLTSETISLISFEKPDRINLIIGDLIRSHIVIQKETGELTLSDFMLGIQAEVIAVEAKLFRWKEAIKQAKRYQMFADKVFVAMDVDGVPKEQEIVALFEDLGIGLCVVLPTGLEWIVNPRTNTYSIGHEREYIIASVINPSHQLLWSRR